MLGSSFYFVDCGGWRSLVLESPYYCVDGKSLLAVFRVLSQLPSEVNVMISMLPARNLKPRQSR